MLRPMDMTGPPLPPLAARTSPSLRAAWIPLAALCLAFFVEMVDNTLLSIALPTIGRDLGEWHDRAAVGHRRLLADVRRPAADVRLDRRPPGTPPRAAGRTRRVRPAERMRRLRQHD